MRKKRWSRLGLGVCLLGMLFVFQGTTSDHLTECFLCYLENARGIGYLQVNNNTPYNILVYIRGRLEYGPFKIKTTPNFMRTDLPNGSYRVYVFACTPTPDQQPVFYKCYSVNVPTEHETTTLTVTTPIGYIPIPK
ncbi:MAG: hypothetical protein JXO51_05770 [Candidatus Aminicenantes bacterium]|nr:hypothetical protein [Candidatus Aminicenantes bacterium]